MPVYNIDAYINILIISTLSRKFECSYVRRSLLTQQSCQYWHHDAWLDRSTAAHNLCSPAGAHFYYGQRFCLHQYDLVIYFYYYVTLIGPTNPSCNGWLISLLEIFLACLLACSSMPQSIGLSSELSSEETLSTADVHHRIHTTGCSCRNKVPRLKNYHHEQCKWK